jgi:hypothetical protein
MNSPNDQQLRLKAMEMAERANPGMSVTALKAQAAEIYAFLTDSDSLASRGTPTVNDVTDTKTAVTDTEQAHNQKAVDAMNAFYNSPIDAEMAKNGLPITKTVDVGGKPATASRNLADLLPSVNPHTTYPSQNPLDPHANIPDDTKKGYE